VEYDDEFEQRINARRAQRRRELYRTDPLWRLTKLKANRETRLRVKLQLAKVVAEE
jgi:hypothetical protein